MRLTLSCLLMMLLAAGSAVADEPASPRPTAEAQVLAALRAHDDARLRALARRDDPCPWMVADALVRGGQVDAALQFARAAPRPDTARLPAWIETQRVHAASETLRDAVDRSNRADCEVTRRAALEALDALVHQGDAFERAMVEVSRANLLEALGRTAESAEAFLSGGRAAEGVGWLRMAANAFEAAGMAAHADMQYDMVLAAWTQLLTVEQGRGNEAGAAKATMFVGGAYFEVADLQRALRWFEESRRMFAAQGNDDGLAWVLNNIALAHSRRGEYLQEQAALEQALGLAQKVGNRYRIACVTVDLGTAQESFGDYERALALYVEALGRFTDLESVAGIAQCQGNIGHLHILREEWDEAVRWSEMALAGARQAKDTVFTCAALNALGWALLHRGDLQRALALEREAIALARRTRDMWNEAHALQSLADVLMALKKPEEAAGALNESLRVAAQLGSNELEMIGHKGHAKLWLAKGDHARAVYASQRGLECSLRELAGLPERLSATSRLRMRELYAVAVDAAAGLGKPQALFTAMESTRAGALLESLENRDAIRSASIPEPLLELERAARTGVRTAVHRFRGAVAEGDLRGIRARRAELERARDALDRAVEHIQAESKAAAELLYPQPITLAEAQRDLGANDAYVVYSLLGARARAMVVTKRAVRIVDLGEVAVLQEAAQVRFDDPTTDAGPAIARLRALLVEPLKLEKRTQRLLVSPDGALGYVPFALLAGARAVAYVQSATTHRVLRHDAPAPGHGVLALGDPHYGWKTVAPATVAQRGGMHLVPLPATREEARLVGDVVLLGKEATPAGLLRAVGTRERWSAIHLACHGIIDPDRPLRSALALAFEQDGTNLLTCGDVFNRRIPTDLAVLSACETGRGTIVTGEGIVGLTRAFMLAGASRVLVSLWRVDDEATQALMVHFYKHWRPKDGARGMDAARALRAAQAFVRAQPKWKHPYYWAAWSLWGLSDPR